MLLLVDMLRELSDSITCSLRIFTFLKLTSHLSLSLFFDVSVS